MRIRTHAPTKLCLTHMLLLLARARRSLVASVLPCRSPFGNRRVSDSGLSADIGIGTLIGETNAGSLVWPQGAEIMPFDVGATATQPPPSTASREAAPQI